MNKTLRVTVTRVLAMLLSVLLILSTSGCLSFVLFNALEGQQGSPTEQQTTVIEARGDYNDLDFEELCDVLFEYEVSGDSLLLNQIVSDPKALGIEVPRPATLGEYSYEATEGANQFYSEILEALTGGHTIDTSELSEQQRLEAEYIEKVLRQELRYVDFYYYAEPLSPSTGAQAMLPLNLMDYSFRTVDDIDIYLEILEDTPRYFEQLLAHEQKKKELDILMPREAIEDTIEEAYAYTGGVDTHILVTTFNEMLTAALAVPVEDESSGQSISTLTEEEIQAYQQQNLEHIQNYVIPAYEQLIAGLEPLVESCKEGTRLCDYARGTEYYELEMESMGFSEGAASAASTLEAALENYWQIISDNSTDLNWDAMIPESVVQAIGDDPADYIAYVQAHSTAEFASAGDLQYQIKVAPEASPNDYAMAYFMVPPVDDPQHNVITFFPRNIADDVELYDTMAHEGYPGHMYQFYAYSLEDPDNISKLLGSLAYTEGWAMYVQARAMTYLDTDASSIAAYNAYEKFTYGLQARVDIGINFEGWSLSDTERYLDDWGFGSAAESLYEVSIQQPVAYLPYGLGVIEFDDLRQRAEAQLGENFDALAFHQELTSLGPLPFDMLEREYEVWLRAAQSQDV